MRETLKKLVNAIIVSTLAIVLTLAAYQWDSGNPGLDNADAAVIMNDLATEAETEQTPGVSNANSATTAIGSISTQYVTPNSETGQEAAQIDENISYPAPPIKDGICWHCDRVLASHGFLFGTIDEQYAYSNDGYAIGALAGWHDDGSVDVICPDSGQVICTGSYFRTVGNIVEYKFAITVVKSDDRLPKQSDGCWHCKKAAEQGIVSLDGDIYRGVVSGEHNYPLGTVKEASTDIMVVCPNLETIVYRARPIESEKIGVDYCFDSVPITKAQPANDNHRK